MNESSDSRDVDKSRWPRPLKGALIGGLAGLLLMIACVVVILMLGERAYGYFALLAMPAHYLCTPLGYDPFTYSNWKTLTGFLIVPSAVNTILCSLIGASIGFIPITPKRE